MEWTELEETCKKCQKCPLGATRTKCVFGKGNKNAEILFVGEAPGRNEDEQGIPFVGAAGKLLDKLLDETGIKKENIYVANILKCRPPQNRDPLPEEENQCSDYLRNQIRLIKPNLIVCLGRIAAKKIISEDYMITKEHGQFIKKGHYVLTAVYHPAALLRDPRKMEDMKKDLINIKNLIDFNNKEKGETK